MFENLKAAPPDSILGLMDAFQKDARSDKVNLTVGVYKDEQGQTPILASVKKAEAKLLKEEMTKGYLGIEGLTEFNRLVTDLLLGGLVESNRVSAVQTPGGTAALRVTAEMLARNFPGNTIWLSQPTWPNHPALFEAAGLNIQTYPYLDPSKTGLDLDNMLQVLRRDGKPGQLVCLHACCHNPTGIDPTVQQWKQIAKTLADQRMIPFIDFAYLGFGDGIEEDRESLRALLEHHDEIVVNLSFSKNFGLYSERVGAALVINRNEEASATVLSQLKFTVRTLYSNPPRHGGSVVSIILADEDLREQWWQEVNEMRARITTMRNGLVEILKRTGVDRDFTFLLQQKGMFSYTGLNAMQADWLKQHKGIYIVGTGRINVAGLTQRNLEVVSQGIAECWESTRS